MTEECCSLPIGVFDSGVGGISVLAELITYLPREKYIYYGDSANAPYGIRSTVEVKELTFKAVHYLMEKGMKALVVACNTATSAAINELREMLDIPVIGMEPALKPAIELNKPGKIVVMATPVTLREKKFNLLIERLGHTMKVIKLPCPGLVEIIEKNGGQGKELEKYLNYIFSTIDLDEVSSIVLGCTHYVFIKETIQNLLGTSIDLIDGNTGTARHVKRLLEELQILCTNDDKYMNQTEVKLMNSSKQNEIVVLSKKLLEEHLKALAWKGQLKYSEM